MYKEMEQIDNFNKFLNKGEIRKQAEDLLGKLSAAYLGNIAWDNRDKIQKVLDEINNSSIDWEKDVVNSVKERYKQLTSSNTVNLHMKREDNGFY